MYVKISNCLTRFDDKGKKYDKSLTKENKNNIINQPITKHIVLITFSL
jgi:hypothetical protein